MFNDLLKQNEPCPYGEECRNAYNAIKCEKCENNPFNYETINRVGEGSCHDRKTKAYYRFVDNYEPV